MKTKIRILKSRARRWFSKHLRIARDRAIDTYFHSFDPLKASTLVVYWLAFCGMVMMAGPNNPHDLGPYMKLMMQGGPVCFWATCFLVILIARLIGLLTYYRNRITEFAVPVLAMWVWSTLFLSNAIAAFEPGAEPSGLFMLYLGPISIEFFILSRAICDNYYSDFLDRYYHPEEEK